MISKLLSKGLKLDKFLRPEELASLPIKFTNNYCRNALKNEGSSNFGDVFLVQDDVGDIAASKFWMLRDKTPKRHGPNSPPEGSPNDLDDPKYSVISSLFRVDKNIDLLL